MKITMTLGNLQLTVNSVAEMTEDQAVAFMMRIAREVQVTPPVAPPAEKLESDCDPCTVTLVDHGPDINSVLWVLCQSCGFSASEACKLTYGPLPSRIPRRLNRRAANYLAAKLIGVGAAACVSPA